MVWCTIRTFAFVQRHFRRDNSYYILKDIESDISSCRIAIVSDSNMPVAGIRFMMFLMERLNEALLAALF